MKEGGSISVLRKEGTEGRENRFVEKRWGEDEAGEENAETLRNGNKKGGRLARGGTNGTAEGSAGTYLPGWGKKAAFSQE